MGSKLRAVVGGERGRETFKRNLSASRKHVSVRCITLLRTDGMT